MLVWVTLISGTAVCLLGALAVFRVDRRWRREHLRCCRCQRTWYGEGKLCYGCGARGLPYDHVEESRLPTHDWQGWLDTGPVPVVPVGTPAAPRPAVDYDDDAWAAPVVPRTVLPRPVLPPTAPQTAPPRNAPPRNAVPRTGPSGGPAAR